MKATHILFLSWGLMAFEDAPIEIIGGNIPYVFSDQKNGVHNRVYEKIIVGSPLAINLTFTPYQLAIERFSKHQADCQYIASDDPSFYSSYLKLPPEQIIISDTINQVNMRVYSRVGTPPPRELFSLLQRTLIIDEGTYNAFDRNFTKAGDITIIKTNLPQESILKLKQGEGDYAILFDLDAEAYFRSSHTQPLPMSKELSLRTVGEALVCWKSEKTSRLIHHINDKLSLLKKNVSLNPCLFSATNTAS